AALENPTWCDEVVRRYGEQVAIGLDVRGDQLAARGWTREGGKVLDVLARLEDAGCKRYVVTDVTSDGMLTGPNYELLGRICARIQGTVVASGGIATLEDLRRLRGLVPIGVEGAIVGTALYVGNFTLPEALEVCRAPIPADSAPRTRR
ncbi:MAG: HisA/HisF-related TIM barrel protein, partial [Cutibacterium avidum]|nr:HisA/HisF-related TIM barrel protein [Cutibacterium avidum]